MPEHRRESMPCCRIRRVAHAGRFHVAVYGHLLCRGVSLRHGLPEAEVEKMHDPAIDTITAVALVLSILLLGYLTLTMLFPEKF
jgi:K+-transporting ATPase KdpF subunit